MPAPVTFLVSGAPLPLNFEGSLQEFYDAILARTSITPSEPWSSFQNGGSIPSSDVGPVLYNGTEWRVFDTSLGSYTYHKQNGAGLVNNTVTLAKLTAGTAGSVLVYNGSGRPAELTAASGVSGQVLTLVGGTTPTWVDSFAPTGKYFEVTLASDQDLNTNGTHQVNFNSVLTSANVTFDVANKKVPVIAGQVWFFWANVQLEDNATVSTDVEASLYIRVDGAATGPSNLINFSFTSALTRQGLNASGLVPVTSDGFVDVAIAVSENTPASPGFKISANLNSRFGGFRII